MNTLNNQQLEDYCQALDILPHLQGSGLEKFAKIANNLGQKLSGQNLIEEGSKTIQRVEPSKKKIIGDTCDVNQLLPFKDPSYFELYRDALRNHWVPEEIPMQADIALLKEKTLRPAEMRIIALTLGFFAPADSIVANNVMINLAKHITLPEARFYLIKQGFEEVLHSHSYIYIIQSYGELLGYTEKEIFNMYHELPSVALKMAWASNKLRVIEDPDFSLVESDYPSRISYLQGIQKFLINYIAFASVIEGLFFYCSFVQVLALARIGKMTQFAEQVQYIMRDEIMHIRVGVKIIHDIIKQFPEVWSYEFKKQVKTMILEGLYVEMAFAAETVQDGILGLNKQTMFAYLQCLADERLRELNLEPEFLVSDPFSWLNEIIHIKKEKNFFETRVTDYQTGGALKWD